MQGLPMAWAEALGGGAALAEVGVSGDLLFDGDWDIDAGDTLRARARLTRAKRRHPRAGRRGRAGHAHHAAAAPARASETHA